MMEKKKRLSHGKIVHYIINALLVLGTLTVLFPLYMTVIIAFKKPSEMTNDISGALSLPSSWNLDNFVEAIKITDFWHTLGNSLLITCVTVVLCILLHSLAGYVIGRKMAKHKIFKASYYYIVSGMFVPFAVLMMPLVKQTAQLGIANRFGVIVLYTVFFMPMNLMLYAGYLKNIPTALEEAAHVDGASAFKIFWKIIFPNMKPMHVEQHALHVAEFLVVLGRIPPLRTVGKELFVVGFGVVDGVEEVLHVVEHDLVGLLREAHHHD